LRLVIVSVGSLLQGGAWWAGGYQHGLLTQARVGQSDHQPGSGKFCDLGSRSAV
jgi:hypothetical protein